MPNLWGTSPVSCEEGGCSYGAWMVSGRRLGWATSWERRSLRRGWSGGRARLEAGVGRRMGRAQGRGSGAGTWRGPVRAQGRDPVLAQGHGPGKPWGSV